MHSRLWITLLVAIALIVGSVGIASAIPTNADSGARNDTQVLGARLVSPVVHSVEGSTLPTTTTIATTTTSTSTTTTTTTPARTPLRPGPLAQPAPAAPVT